MLTLFLFLFLLPSGNAQAEKPKPLPSQSQELEPLDLCTLYAHIDEYKEHRVRVRAFITESLTGKKDINISFEDAVLYDPKCHRGEPLMHYIFKRKVKGIKLLRKILAKRPYAFTTVEGIVHAPSLKSNRMEIEIDSVLEAEKREDGLQRD